MYNGDSIRLPTDFSAETLWARRQRHDIVEVWKGKKPTTKTTPPCKIITWNSVRDFQGQPKQKFITTEEALQERLKRLL